MKRLFKAGKKFKRSFQEYYTDLVSFRRELIKSAIVHRQDRINDCPEETKIISGINDCPELNSFIDSSYASDEILEVMKLIRENNDDLMIDKIDKVQIYKNAILLLEIHRSDENNDRTLCIELNKLQTSLYEAKKRNAEVRDTLTAKVIYLFIIISLVFLFKKK